MRSVTTIILLVFFAHANAEDSSDKLVDKLVAKLSARTLRTWFLDQSDVDDTTLGKPGHLALSSPQVSSAALGPRLVPSLDRAPLYSRTASVSSGRQWKQAPEFEQAKSELRHKEAGSLGYVSRRQALATGTALGLGLTYGDQRAHADGLATFCGTAFPPATYGAYDPDACEKAVYTFEYPEDWKADPLSKVEKGTKSIDGRVFKVETKKGAKKLKSEQVFIVVLSRAGEDDANYKLQNAEKTLIGFAGADPDLLDSINAGDVSSKTSEVDGRQFLDLEIKNEDGFNFLVRVTTFEGKLFAVFAKAPAAVFDTEQDTLAKIVASFKLTGKTSSR